MNNQLENMFSDFVSGKMTGADFEQQFLELWRGDRSGWDHVSNTVMEELFFEVEELCADEKLRDGSDLDENQLREKSAMALEKLNPAFKATDE